MNELETKIELLLNYFGWQIFVNTVSRPSRPSRCWQSWTPGWWQGLVLACGRAESRRQSPPVGLCPNQKAYPAYPVSTCNRCSFYGGFGCLWRIWRIWRVLALHFASGHGLDFGLVTRPLSLRHEITSLWVSPGSLKGRHNMTQRDTQRDPVWVLRCPEMWPCHHVSRMRLMANQLAKLIKAGKYNL